jgi:hypothetical protein
MSGRPRTVGGDDAQPSATRETQRVLDFISSKPDDRELSAVIFAGLVASPLLVASVVLIYLSF